MRGFFARLSGYDQLKKRYPASGKLEGPAYARQTVQIGPVRYRRCVTVHISDRGLYLQPRILLTRYPPVLIPWDEIKRVTDSRIYWARAKRLSIGEPEVGTVTVPMGLYALIQPRLRLGSSEH